MGMGYLKLDGELIMLGGLLGILSPVNGVVDTVTDTVGGLAESLSPGALHGDAATGNLLGNSGVTDDLVSGISEGDFTGAISDVYTDLLGVDGAVYDLAHGGGLGVEGLVGGLLGTADGLLGGEGGLLGGDLLGGLTGGLTDGILG